MTFHSGEGGKFLITTAREGKPHVERVTEIRPPENCSSQELFNEPARRSLKE
ncbi:MAG: hypothetical protein LBV80_05855 [Deltaproteobacteria bacterium]|nr:hypothetical protein [Deltaproteobacteria bacterium]